MVIRTDGHAPEVSARLELSDRIANQIVWRTKAWTLFQDYYHDYYLLLQSSFVFDFILWPTLFCFSFVRIAERPKNRSDSIGWRISERSIRLIYHGRREWSENWSQKKCNFEQFWIIRQRPTRPDKVDRLPGSGCREQICWATDWSRLCLKCEKGWSEKDELRSINRTNWSSRWNTHDWNVIETYMQWIEFAIWLLITFSFQNQFDKIFKRERQKE